MEGKELVVPVSTEPVVMIFVDDWKAVELVGDGFVSVD